VGCGYIDWIGLAQDRDRWRTLVSAVMNLRVPWNAGNFLTSWKSVSFSRTLHHGVSKYGYNATCFGPHTRSHQQADETPKKICYVNRIMLLYIIHIYCMGISFTNIVSQVIIIILCLFTAIGLLTGGSGYSRWQWLLPGGSGFYLVAVVESSTVCTRSWHSAGLRTW